MTFVIVFFFLFIVIMDNVIEDGTKVDLKINGCSVLFVCNRNKYTKIAHLEQLDQVLSDTIEALDTTLCEADAVEKKAMKQEKRKWTKQQKQLQRDYLPRLQKYQMHFQQFGDRNSFSKTDVDATFKETFGNLPDYIVADAGYGGEENYKYLLEETASLPLMPYTIYRKEQKHAYIKNEMHRDHWEYRAADDFFICPNQRKLTFQRYAYRTNRYGYIHDFKVYECEDFSDCPLRAQCTKAKSGKNRKIHYNPI